MTTTRFWTAFAVAVLGVIIGGLIGFYAFHSPKIGGAVGVVVAAGFYLSRSRPSNLNARK